jgi:hypothetical protein
VPAHEFLLAIDLCNQHQCHPMVQRITADVLAHFGYGADTIGPLVSSLDDVLSGAGQRRIEFRARGGELEIVVSGEGARDWRTSRRLPT